MAEPPQALKDMRYPWQEILSGFLMAPGGFCPVLIPNGGDAYVKRMPGTTVFFIGQSS